MPAGSHQLPNGPPCQLAKRTGPRLNRSARQRVQGGMYRLLLLIPYLGAMTLLSCAKTDPVDEEAVAPSDGLLGDLAAKGLSSPANAATAEAVQQAALPAAPGGLNWSWRPQENLALFGPPGTPAFSIQCQKQREGTAQLIFVRYLPPVTGGRATLSFTGNGQIASVPIAAVANPDGLGGEWRAAVAPDDIARDVAEVFSGPGTVELSVSGTPPLVVPATGEPRQALAACLAG